MGAGRCFLLGAVDNCLTSGTGLGGTAIVLFSFISSLGSLFFRARSSSSSSGLADATATFVGNATDEAIGTLSLMGGWKAVCLGVTLILFEEINTHRRRVAWVDGGGEGGRRTYPSTGVVRRLLPAALLTELRL